jgi:cell division protease FtsH
MSENFKQIAYGGEREEVFLGEEIARRRDYSETTAYEVDKETEKILIEAYDRAADIITEHREGLDRLVDELLEDEVVSGERVLEIVGAGKKIEEEVAAEKSEEVL